MPTSRRRSLQSATGCAIPRSETGRIRSRRARFQIPSSVSLLAFTEFRGENSVSFSQPIICVPKRTHRVHRRTHRVCRRIQSALSSETVLSKQCSSGVEKLTWSSLKGFFSRALVACKNGRFCKQFSSLRYRTLTREHSRTKKKAVVSQGRTNHEVQTVN